MKSKSCIRPKPTKADLPHNCPWCGTSLLADPIPHKWLHMYSGRYFKREIGQYDMARDMTVSYQCPDCKHTWSREDHDELRKSR